MAQAPKRGAPPKAAAERKEVNMTIWMTETLKGEIEVAAAQDEAMPASWARTALARAVRQGAASRPHVKEGALLKITDADGVETLVRVVEVKKPVGTNSAPGRPGKLIYQVVTVRETE